ncbi:MAG TPA: site-specific DNA-methyltransferase [Ktedonobacter sp.]|nr:site-specific DNA-methyltransferase [Ktedonobacter sp.]
MNDAPTQKSQIYQGNCLDILPTLAANSVDLIVTSPPYADQRKDTYGGVDPDKYVEWFLPISQELKRVLKDEGSFILNIKERVVNGERHTYVLELILALRKQGWLWTEEYMWHKRNSYPGKWPNRFRDAWERCLHFTKQKHFAMYQDEVRVPMGDWKHSRLKNLSETDKRRDNSHVQSGFGKKIDNWIGRDLAYPDNVLHLATECGNQGHSAAFPVDLPSWFIKLFTMPGDTVLDPFIGSGTTAVAAKQLSRECIGIEIDPTYVHIAQERVNAVPPQITAPQSILEYLEQPVSEDTEPATNERNGKRVEIGTFKQAHKKHQLVEQAELEFS